MKSFATLLFLLAFLQIPSLGEVYSLKGGEILTPSVQVGSPGNLVLDFGYKVPEINGTDPILFEIGGQGFGFTFAHIENRFYLFQDWSQESPRASSAIIWTQGVNYSIRLDINYTLPPGERYFSISARPEDGITSLLTSRRLDERSPTEDLRISEVSETGLGGFVGTYGGQQNTAIEVFEDLHSLEKQLESGGSAVLGADVIIGVLYTGADAEFQRTQQKPFPRDYVFEETEAPAIHVTYSIDSDKNVTLMWTSEPNWIDQVQYSTDLNVWLDDLPDSEFEGTVESTNAVFNTRAVDTTKAIYYRVIRTRAS